jgi:epoxyqueuosine reductase
MPRRDPVDAGALAAAVLGAGLDLVGFADARPFLDARAALIHRKAAGLHGGMGFTFNQPERSTDPVAALPGARSLLVGAVAYPHHTPERPAAGGPWGRVAAYARRDYYEQLRSGLRVAATVLKAAGHRARVVVDDNALVDRPAAQRAGLGWYGKSGNLLHPELGSWFVIGSVVTTAELPAGSGPLADGCGTCRRCLDGCPTGAIIAPGVVDAGRCLSWLLQQPGVFPRRHRVAVGDRIYGCDDCQEVCPPSRKAAEAAGGHVPVAIASSFSADPEPPLGRGADGAWTSILDLLALDDASILRRHDRWYIAGRDPRWVRRNALLVLGNRADPHDPAVIAALCRYLEHPDALLREHAAWAARRLGRADLALARGTDPAVATELAEPAPPVVHPAGQS